MKKKYAIAFIFIEEIHHLYHFITIAIELSKKQEVHVLTFSGQHEILENTLERLGGNKVKVERRPTKLFRAITDKLKKRKFPRAGFWMKKNQHYILNNFDAVVFSDYNYHKLLKARGNKKLPKFIKLPHGIAGREYVYKKDLLDFDLHLIFGQFYADELQNRNLLKNHAIIGYPKLEAVKGIPLKKIFSNHKKTVVYNPHFSASFSSWYPLGIEILEYFYHQEEFNLIFAPHINLFNKRGGDDVSKIPEKYYTSHKIHIDLGSIDSVNMTYVRNADVYLGEVSSQVYEFILEPKPTIFINIHKANYKNNTAYRFWETGQVIETINELDTALKNAFSTFSNYKNIQNEINRGNIYKEEGSTASQRATKAIISYLGDN